MKNYLCSLSSHLARNYDLAVATGTLPVDAIKERISFMREKLKWSGTVQGQNGVFNDRLTDKDIAAIVE